MHLIRHVTETVFVFVIAVSLAVAQGTATVERWQVQATGPVTITMDEADTGTGVWARSSDGAWHKLEAGTRDGAIVISLSAAQMRGGSALVVINPPPWLQMDDAEPPAVVRFTIDGVNHAQESEVQLGWTDRMPREVVLAVQDELNPLDPSSPQVRFLGRTLRPGDPGVQFIPHGERAGTLRVRVRALEGASEAIRGRLELSIDDYAIDEVETRRALSWALVPSTTLDDGTVVTIDSLTSAEGWEDWTVVIDGEVMTDADTTTAGKTWLSDKREDEHWIRFEFPEPRIVDGIDLWWPYYQKWRTSRNYQVQTWDGHRWVTQLEVTDQEECAHSEHRFDPVTTTAVRVLQAPMGGQAERQDLMWLAEAQVHFAQ